MTTLAAAAVLHPGVSSNQIGCRVGRSMRSTICPNRVALGGREATRILVEDMNRARKGCKSPYISPCEPSAEQRDIPFLIEL